MYSGVTYAWQHGRFFNKKKLCSFFFAHKAHFFLLTKPVSLLRLAPFPVHGIFFFMLQVSLQSLKQRHGKTFNSILEEGYTCCLLSRVKRRVGCEQSPTLTPRFTQVSQTLLYSKIEEGVRYSFLYCRERYKFELNPTLQYSREWWERVGFEFIPPLNYSRDQFLAFCCSLYYKG